MPLPAKEGGTGTAVTKIQLELAFGTVATGEARSAAPQGTG
jgi:hypothetical protein